MVAADNWDSHPNAIKLWKFGQTPLQGRLVYHNMDWNVGAPNHVSHANAKPGMTPEQQAELERFKKTVAETRLALKEVRKNLRQDAEGLVFWTKVANIALMPLLVAFLGLLLALIRKRKTA